MTKAEAQATLDFWLNRPCHFHIERHYVNTAAAVLGVDILWETVDINEPFPDDLLPYPASITLRQSDFDLSDIHTLP
ncbi:MAG: hypothetical protein GY753_16985 [Gammaproteobacteria bacterium]|nr:hypothetical protein [Gammaproteobacteria bacterium]